MKSVVCFLSLGVRGRCQKLPEMRLLLFTAVCLCAASVLGHADDDIEEATVTTDDELPIKVLNPAEEVTYVSPKPSGHIYFAEHFDSPEEFEAKWVRSQAKKDEADEDIAKYDGNFVSLLFVPVAQSFTMTLTK